MRKHKYKIRVFQCPDCGNKTYAAKSAGRMITDPGDVVIDPCFGSGSTARAAVELGRNFYGFEINKEFYRRAKEEMLKFPEEQQLSIFDI